MSIILIKNHDDTQEYCEFPYATNLKVTYINGNWIVSWNLGIQYLEFNIQNVKCVAVVHQINNYQNVQENPISEHADDEHADDEHDDDEHADEHDDEHDDKDCNDIVHKDGIKSDDSKVVKRNELCSSTRWADYADDDDDEVDTEVHTETKPNEIKVGEIQVEVESDFDKEDDADDDDEQSESNVQCTFGNRTVCKCGQSIDTFISDTKLNIHNMCSDCVRLNFPEVICKCGGRHCGIRNAYENTPVGTVINWFNLCPICFREMDTKNKGKKIPCKNMKETGKCTYGAKCRFSHHIELVKFKTILCENYLKNSNCPWNDRCKFAHGEDELR